MPGQRTIMILGAGIFQVAAIRKASELGYHVISTDFLPNNIGHRFAHETLNISTVDTDAIAAAAVARKIDGIFSMASEVALPSVARVVEELGLPGPTKSVVETLIQKDRFHRFQAAHGLDGPLFLEVNDFAQAIADWPGGPAIVKPAMSSGSRGVAKIQQVDAHSRRLFETAREYSVNGKVCLEEYINGQDVSVEGFVRNSTIQHAFITEKHVQGLAVVGHELPTGLDSDARKGIIDQLEITLRSVDYETGPFDADFRIGQGRSVLLEITPRLGGNGISSLVEAVYGVSLIELSIRHAMGERLEDVGVRTASDIVPHAAILLRSACSGTVKSFATESSFRSCLPSVADLSIDLTRGQAVERFAHGGHVFGYCVVRMPDGIGFNAMAGKVLEAVDIKL